MIGFTLGALTQLRTGQTVWAQLNSAPFAYLAAYGMVVLASLANECAAAVCNWGMHAHALCYAYALSSIDKLCSVFVLTYVVPFPGNLVAPRRASASDPLGSADLLSW